MTHPRTSLAILAAAAVVATGCGSTQGAGSGTEPGHARPHTTTTGTTATTSPPTTSLDGLTLQSVTTLDADIGSQMKRYLRDLGRIRAEVRLADQAADHEASIASSGDFSAMAADSAEVERHLARATVLARRVKAPPGLEHAHANLVRAFAVGRRMAARLSSVFEHIGPDSQRAYRERVRPLERRSLRFANLWYAQAAAAMAAGNIHPPKWIDHLFDWS
jgi:hypothetical protein